MPDVTSPPIYRYVYDWRISQTQSGRLQIDYDISSREPGRLFASYVLPSGTDVFASLLDGRKVQLCFGDPP